MRWGLHWSAHIAMHKLQKLGSPNHFIFRKNIPLMFVYIASFTHMAMALLSSLAIDHFLQLFKTHHVEVAKSLVFKGSQHLPPYSIFCTSSRGPHPYGFLSRDSQMGVPKLPRLELLQLCRAIISCSDL